MCRLSGWSVENGELRVTYGLTDYRELVGTNISHPEIGARFGDEYLSNGSGVCSTIETRDGRLVLHRRNERVFEYPGKLDTCGGALEPIESPDGPVADPFAMATREIEEELGIPAAMIAEMTCLGIARDGLTLKPEMLMRTRISLDSAEIPALPGDEHAQLMTVPGDPASLNTWLAEHWSEMAPASLACLVAHTACIFADGIASTWPSR
jgi:8-oxo-dGTP pyrophosphatase MutT (NUDIX family)